MKPLSYLPLLLTAASLSLVAGSSSAGEAGAGAGLQALGNTSIARYELLYRPALPYTTRFGKGRYVTSAIEISLGMVHEHDANDATLGEVAVIPELVLHFHPRLEFLAGLGFGLMSNEGKFTKHDLGGPFFFASKVGLRLPVSSSWGVELIYYHQSNGGLYEHNASLNMPSAGLYFSL